jgi:hypothetical protein
MTSKEFIIWLRGFSEGVHEYNITPKQWETFKEKLAQVDDNIIPIGGVIADHNTFKVNDQGFYQMPSHQYGTSVLSKGTFTTTPGNNSITFSSGSGLGVGTIYTTNGAPNWYSTVIPEDKTLLHD